MNIKKLTKTVSSVLLLSAALFTGCQKDGDRVFSLFAESFDGNGKLAVNGASANWVNGDQIKINGETKTVAVDGSGNATVSAVPRAEYYRAVYPASVYAGSLASNNITVSLPSVYNYVTSGGRQILHSPMAAYMEDDGVTDQIFFKHLTGAIVVRITNSVEYDLNVSQIKITSSNYNISGDLNVNLANLASISPVAGGNSVTMSFAQNPLMLSASGGTADIQIPVAAVGDGNKFTVEIASTFINANGNTKYLTFTKQQTTGGALNRGQVAYAMVTMGRNADGCVEDIPLPYNDGAYEISTPSQFLVFVDAVNSNSNTYYGGPTPGNGAARNVFFRLTANLDMTGYSCPPIHDYHKTLDGNGKTISNLHIVQDGSVAAEGLGLFATHGSYNLTLVQNLTLQNLTLEYTGPDVETSIGAFVGKYQASGATALNNCHVNGMTIVSSTLATKAHIGGLIGQVAGGGNIDIVASGASDIVYDVTNTIGTINFGGLVGFCASTNNDRTVSITNSSYSNSTPLNVHYRKSTALCYGGIIGQVQGRNISVSSCTATHNASLGGQSTSYIAGLIGSLQGTARTAAFLAVTASGSISYRGDKVGGVNPVANNKTGYTVNTPSVTTTGLTMTPYNF